MSEHEGVSAATEKHNGAADSREAARAATNGFHEGQKAETMHRAEEMVDRLAANIGEYARCLGHQILRLAARAREEAEDMWAEAESIRRRKS